MGRGGKEKKKILVRKPSKSKFIFQSVEQYQKQRFHYQAEPKNQNIRFIDPKNPNMRFIDSQNPNVRFIDLKQRRNGQHGQGEEQKMRESKNVRKLRKPKRGSGLVKGVSSRTVKFIGRKIDEKITKEEDENDAVKGVHKEFGFIAKGIKATSSGLYHRSQKKEDVEQGGKTFTRRWFYKESESAKSPVIQGKTGKWFETRPIYKNYRWIDTQSGGGQIARNPRVHISTDDRKTTKEGGIGKSRSSTIKYRRKDIKKQRRTRQIVKEASQKIREESVQIIIKAIKKAIAFVRNTFSIVGLIIALLLLVMFLVIGMGSCSLLLSNMSGVIMSSYLSEDQDIHDTELFATKLEAELDKKIKDLPTAEEWAYIDEFRYDLDPIGHDPFVLMAYLTLTYQDFTFEQMQPVIQELHDKRYELTLEVETETRHDSDGEPYTYYILNVTLRSKSIEEVIQAELDADDTGEKQEWYNVLMETKGNRQSYKNPFTYDWTSSISSSYGYRVDPFGTELQVHRGLDIPVPVGTPIYAGLTGYVEMAGYDDIYGYYIALKDAKEDRIIKYAHCDRLLVSIGAEVIGGETVIAESGNTGESTGPHVHIEIKEDGQYQNPTYLIEWEAE